MDDALTRLLDRMVACLNECQEDLAIQLDSLYSARAQYPIEQRRWDRDMRVVQQARDLLAEWRQARELDE